MDDMNTPDIEQTQSTILEELAEAQTPEAVLLAEMKFQAVERLRK